MHFTIMAVTVLMIHTYSVLWPIMLIPFSCCAHVGYHGGQQILFLYPNCLELSFVAHEIGHTVGFHHEQERPDRDDHINVYTSEPS